MRLDLAPLGRLRAEQVPLPPPDAETLGRLAGLARVAILDSAAGGRFTLLAAAPLARLTWRPGAGEVLLPGGAAAREADFSALLRGALAATALPGGAPLPFGPGWIGCFGYGLRAAFEEVAERHEETSGIADVELAYYPAVAVHDRRDRAWWLFWRERAEDSAQTLRTCLQRTAPRSDRPLPPPAPPVAQTSRTDYLKAVRRAIGYIHAGDIFQVNYAHRFAASYPGAALPLYLALRTHNPAPYCALLDLGDGRAVCSTSPELFLRLRGRTVVTRPIKGTRPRGATPEEDAALLAELERSGKDAAELAMIIDLERNDLGRVCRPGTIAVTRPAFYESYASVHHRVAEVVGELEEGRDRADLLWATFPGGSITGAPKIRAMQIIDELEEARRGPYTGAVGILADDGSMDLNIAIRTAVLARGKVSVHVGGAIVAESDPSAEYEETLAKGRAILEALG